MIPIRRLFADAVAFPLITRGSNLRERFVELACSRGFSVDQAEMLVGEAWSKELRTAASDAARVAHLLRHADKLLQQDGSRLLVAAVGTSASSYEAWRAVSLLVPSDVFVAAHAAQHLGGEPFADVPSLMPPQLRRWAESARLAETHLHLGAALGPLDVWLRSMADPCEGRDVGEDWPSRGPNALPTVDELFDAAFRRIALAFLVSRPGGDSVGEGVKRLVQKLAPLSGVHPKMAKAALLDTLGSTGARRSRQDRRMLQRVLRGFWRSDRPTSERADPVERLLGRSAVEAEVRLMARVLFRLKTNDDSSETRLLHDLWAKSLATRCRFHRALTQQPGTPGLAWFQTFLSRSRDAQGAVPRSLSKVLAHVGGESGLDALEVRFPPLPTPGENLRAVRYVAEGMRPDTELGIVFHFTTAIPRPRRQTSGGARVLDKYRRWLRENLIRARALGRFLESYPEALALVRGVDVAGRELALPIWLRLPVLSEVRGAADRAAIALRRRRPEWAPLTLRATHHVGEEFLSTTQGVRRIHALITAKSHGTSSGMLDSGALRVGDRLGHALALGQDVDRFFDHGRGLRMPVIERLEDLLFELERYRLGELECAAGRLAQVKSEARAMAKRLFDRPCGLDELIQWRRDLHDVGLTQAMGVAPVGSDGRAGNATLLARTLYDGDVLERGAETVTTDDTPAERAAAKELQSWVRKVVSRRELTVEACPTSNLLVAELPSLADHPVLSLRTGETPLAVSINTDNPLIHATRFEDELALFYHALLSQGSSRKDAEAALAEVVEAGWRSRFSSERTLLEETKSALVGLGRRP